MVKRKVSKEAKRHALYIGIIAIVAVLGLSTLALVGLQIEPGTIPPGQGPAEPVELQATFETVNPTCSSGTLDEMDIRAVSTSIIITAPIQTPTPCYSVDGTATLQGSDIRVDITTSARPGICIQCVGVVTARATIRNLPAGLYGLDVRTPDRAALTTIRVGI